MQKKVLSILISLIVFSIPLYAIVSGRTITAMLDELCTELQLACQNLSESQHRFDEDYDRQHQRMIDVISKSNELSILLYTQEERMTFDLAYALKKVSSDYKDFSKDRRPYDRILNSLNYEIDRYARLIESLRRLPPIKQDIELEIVPDSLLYRNDSIDVQMSDSLSLLEKEIIRISNTDTLVAPIVLDSVGISYRDSCIVYASELLKMHADNRATLIADSTHYLEAYLRMKEAYDYAEARYFELEKYVFIDGQTPFKDILSNPGFYWSQVVEDLERQYDFNELDEDKYSASSDSTKVSSDGSDNDISYLDNLSSKGENSMLVIVCIIQLLLLAFFWLVTFLLIWLLSRIFKKKLSFLKKKKRLISILIGTVLYFLLLDFWDADEYIQLSIKHINTFLWLLIAISGSLLLRVNADNIRQGVQLYSPTFMITLVIISCRITFMPDRVMNYLFPPILFLIILRQLFFCIRNRNKVPRIDKILGWVSFGIYLISFLVSFIGFTFVSLLILVWWYFQLAVLLTIVCISGLLRHFKRRWLSKRIENARKRITYVSGNEREPLLLGVTWFYDLVKDVVIPIMILMSLSLCIRFSLSMFDFDDLYTKFYSDSFIHLTNNKGFEALRISVRSILFLIALYFILRYLNRSLHSLWHYLRYTSFMRKHNRTNVRANEINLSLGNSIISVLIWLGYAMVIIYVWNIPTGSLGLIAGGLSAGIGLALKDTINNFVYGIQLMGGRLRVGDWIECEGVRGKVTSINYQCVQAETIEGTEMSFLNSSLFGKNFNNLTRNNSYELTTIVVGVAYDTKIERVREVLLEAMQTMRTQDCYGREIVDPKYGINIVVSNLSDSSVDIGVKQYVLVAERIAYVDKAKEVIYDALNDAGITIPYPQCDVHVN